MRVLACGAAAAALALGHAGYGMAHSEDAVQLALRASKVLLADGGRGRAPKVLFSGKWNGPAPVFNPTVETGTLRIFGGFGGDSGSIRLPSAHWKASPRARGWRYDDAAGSAAGITRIDLTLTKRGGTLKVKGGAGFPYEARPVTPTTLSAALAFEHVQWCTQFAAPARTKKGVKAKSKGGPVLFRSTWEGVQAIFARNGCLEAACHGAAPGEGTLDLRPDVAYRNLVDVVSPTGGKLRVERGSRQDSFLWEKLAAATEGYDLRGRGSPMPVGRAPLTAQELEAVRLWIQFGAEETGVVLGTEQMLGGCVPPADPPAIQPAVVPPANEGVQFHAPPWTIPPADGTGLNGEDEVCYATYFNVSDRLPAGAKTPCPDFWGGPEKTCYFYDRTELTQDPNSHHSIIHIYRGAFDLSWEPSAPGDTLGFRFRCHGGSRSGEKCDPRVDGVCGPEGECRGEVVSSLACIGYGPPDYSRGLTPNGAASSDNAPSVGGSQQPFSRNVFPAGVFGVLPAEGVIVWNSHAFNLFERPVTNEQWWNVYFATADDRLFPARAIFDATDIFVQQVPPFEEREYCRTVTFPIGTRIFEFSSHTHERGRLFRLWGPGVDASCRSTAANPGACLPETGAPILTTTEYNDPTVLNLNHAPFVLDDPDPAARRFKFCAVFDNGAADPLRVKRNSTSPIPPQFGNLAPGGKCYYRGLGGRIVDTGLACVNGARRGLPCGGDDRACDSASGAGDGVCDACPLVGGVTTDDEMFILLGAYFCAPGSDCAAGVCVAGPRMGEHCDGSDARCPGSRCGPYAN
jgi:hypothetical protein